MGKQWKHCQTIFWGSKITADGDCSHEIKRRLLLGRKVMTNLDSIFKSRDITLPTNVHLIKAMVLPVVMYGCELNCEESWMSKNWCFWTVVLEKTLESTLDCKEIKPSDPKGNQSWIFIGRTDAKDEAPILCHLMQRTDSSEKTLMLGKIEGGRRREWQDEMVEWHHQLDGHEFEQAPELVMDWEAWHAVVRGVAKSWTYWVTELKRREMAGWLDASSMPAQVGNSLVM